MLNQREGGLERDLERCELARRKNLRHSDTHLVWLQPRLCLEHTGHPLNLYRELRPVAELRMHLPTLQIHDARLRQRATVLQNYARFYHILTARETTCNSRRPRAACAHEGRRAQPVRESGETGSIPATPSAP